ncbi:MAG TPA: cytochrome c biogenesis protein CcdA [Herpetosiphonaceae bacterium]|nr:cytochrome c biogenesis protein CcdA [Herpetosiphonaceae bacterium]
MNRTITEYERQPSRRLGNVAALLALGATVVAAVLTDPGAGGLTSSVEAASGAAGTALSRLATALPLGYAFGAGMVASMNPCGFALLPAYLGLYLTAEARSARQSRLHHPLARAAAISLMMTAGFVAIFGTTGLVLSLATTAVARFLPWLGLLIGVLLIVAGGRMLGGAMLYTRLGEQVAGRLGRDARQLGARGYLAYGLAYGAASLSCTLPIFLTLVGSALAVGGFVAAAFQFVLYALGMGFVITVLTFSTMFFEYAVITRVRRLGRYLHPVSAVLLLIAGAFVVYYWLTLGGLLPRIG